MELSGVSGQKTGGGGPNRSPAGPRRTTRSLHREETDFPHIGNGQILGSARLEIPICDLSLVFLVPGCDRFFERRRTCHCGLEAGEAFGAIRLRIIADERVGGNNDDMGVHTN